MAVSQGPTPKWLFTDKNGEPLAGGKMYTKRDVNRSENKPVYSDPAQTFPYSNPVVFDNNGMQGPFYWLEDEAYYLDIRDANNIPQFTVEHYVPEASGGSTVNVYNMTRNLINNGQFFYNIGQTSNPIGTTILVIAPGTIDDFIDGDILFEKSNTAVTDQIIFNTLSPGDTGYEATPIFEFNYACSAVGAGGESYKRVRYTTKNVRSLEGQSVVISLSAHSSSLSTIEISCIQNFGTGGSPSADVETILGSQVLTNTKTRYDFSVTIPSIGGKVLGTNGNDYLSICVRLPLDTVCNISYTNMQLITGNRPVPYIYETPQMAANRFAYFRTGDVKLSFHSGNAIPGWVLMNDGTIGNASSGATTRANKDCFFLFVLLYRNVSDTWAPVSGGRSGNPDVDFAAGKTMTLPKSLGRALAMAGSGAGLSARVLGESLGEETHVLTTPEIPPHTHTTNTTEGSAGGVTYVQASDVLAGPGTIPTNSTGGGGAHNNMQPTTFLNVYIKL